MKKKKDRPKSTVRKREGVRKGVYILPNLLTSGSLFCGFYAITAVFNGKYLMAAVAILVATLFDVIDGKVARLTRSTTRFGIEYDSLADLISFGVAPAILVLSWALQPYGRLGWVGASLYLVCGALRLARFNVQVNTVESRYFRGLPIPAAACFIAATVLFFHRLGEGSEAKHLFILFLVYALAFLMVSNIRYYSFKDLNLLRKKPFSTLVTMVLAIVVVMAEPEIMLFIFTSCYLMLGPVSAVLGWYRKREVALHEKKTESLMR